MGFMEEMEGLGVDVKEGMDRVMGDESLYKMMLGMFVDSVKSSPIAEEDFNSEQLDALIAQIHTLKGTAGNLSIQPLFTRYTEMLTLLRSNQPAEARDVFIKTVPIQNTIIDCICKYQ